MIFIHIPKTGGTTFIHHVLRSYGPGSVIGAYPPRKLPEVPVHYPRMIAGHFPAGFLQNADVICPHVTILREPVDRMMSYYYFVLASPANRLHGVAASFPMQLFFDHKEPDLDNHVTRMLSGVGPFVEPGKLNRGHLERAKENFLEFAVVGFLDHFDIFLKVVNTVFGWKLPMRYKKEVINKNRPKPGEITSEEREAIERHNALDIELYGWAQEKASAGVFMGSLLNSKK